MNVAAFISKGASIEPETVAVRGPGGTFTYAELNIQVGRFAAALFASGIRSGDRVAIFMRNRIEYVVALFGCFRAGAAVVPVNFRLHPTELEYIIHHAEVTAIVLGETPGVATDDVLSGIGRVLCIRVGGVAAASGSGTTFAQFMSRATEPMLDDVEISPRALAWLFYTSGTTGRPKGAMLSHRNLERMTVNCLADICSFRPRETVLHVAPFSHGSGLYLLPALARQTTNLISESFVAADVLDVVGRERVSVIAFMAPTMIVMLLAAPPGEDLSSLRCVIYGGAPLHVEHARSALRRFGQVFVQLYGQGEAPMTISYLPADDHIADDDETLATAGIPRTDVEVRIVGADDLEVERGCIGEVCARGDVVMEGYWRNPEATARTLRGGWLHTGDLGYIDSRGRLVLVDRMNDVIITGGSNVYPREVEEVLLRHPGIAEAAVFATPDPLWGEVVAAAVVARPNCRLDVDDILEHCRGHIASFKKPRRIQFVESLPKNSYGKVLRTALRETTTTGDSTAT